VDAAQPAEVKMTLENGDIPHFIVTIEVNFRLLAVSPIVTMK
jgi:flavin-binding protein dodecin